MLGWIYSIIIGNFCFHNWEVIDSFRFFEKPGDKMPIYMVYHLKCKKCGNMKSVKI